MVKSEERRVITSQSVWLINSILVKYLHLKDTVIFHLPAYQCGRRYIGRKGILLEAYTFFFFFRKYNYMKLYQLVNQKEIKKLYCTAQD